MSFNLIRNARVFFTTNVDAQGVVLMTGATASNTREIQVLDGLSYSQNTASETVAINEAGATPVRGQRQFNTALEAVDFSMTTYMRPNGVPTNVTSEESVLWNALLATDAIGGAAPAWSEAAASATLVVTNSQTHQLQAFGLIIVVDGTSYIIDNCALDSASVDFGLDAIAQIAWSGKGTILRQVELVADIASPVVITGGVSEVATVAVDATSGNYTLTYDSQTTGSILFNASASAVKTALELLSTVTANSTIVSVTGGPGDSGATTPYIVTFDAALGDVNPNLTAASVDLAGGGGTVVVTIVAGTSIGSALAKVTTAPFIANKLSTLAVTKDIGATGKAYTIAITGGNLTFSNNITYLTPANLGVVNKPATYFTGARSISGSVTAYLRTGTNNSAGLLSDMLATSDTAVDPSYAIQINIGGTSNTTRVEFDLPATVLTIPSVSTEQVISTTINFTAQGFTGTGFDITSANEAEVRYFAP